MGSCLRYDSISAPTARKNKASFLAEFEPSVLAPVGRDKMSVGRTMEAYVAWGRSEGKYVDRRVSQSRAPPWDKVHERPIGDIKSGPLKTPTGDVKPKKSPAKKANRVSRLPHEP